MTKFHVASFRKFNSINDTIINYKENKDYIKIIFLIDIYRENKYSGFQIYCYSYFRKKDKKIIFKVLKITGNIGSENIYILPGYEFESQNNLNVYSSCFPYTKYNGSDSYIRSSENQRILPSQQQTKKILNERKNNRILDFINRSYNCYGSDGIDVYNCESSKNNFGLYKKPGIWDRPCNFDDECPFYKSNKNYPNNRGGCLKGICEMPLNVENLTWRKFNKLTKPYCYNCDDKTSDCCEKQKNNNKLLSPDYAFSGDSFERYKYREDLKKNGLKWGRSGGRW